jgi:site-specific DNA-cytosine methylase
LFALFYHAICCAPGAHYTGRWAPLEVTMLLSTDTTRVTYTVMHFFGGSGGGAMGFARGEARGQRLEARFDTLGSIDSNPAACRDFTALVGVPATCLDLFTREQYRAFHSAEPPSGWQEATHHDVRAAAQLRNPDVVFLSPPCKGFSGLLSKRSAASVRYAALNGLVTRSIRLMMEAWADDLPALILLENVPRIAQRGRPLLDEVIELLDAHGYAVAETTHDCGELGGLAQRRKRFLLVASLRTKVRNYLYEPPRKQVRGVGTVLERLPLPDAPACGPMHQSPRLQWQTWVRLALIPAGRDWRALEKVDWQRLGIAPMPAMGQHAGKMRVEDWQRPSHTITGSDRVGSGALSIADPRLDRRAFNNVYRVVEWTEAAPAVTGGGTPTAGGGAVADPRAGRDLGRYKPYGVLPWDRPVGTVTGEAAAGAGVFSVADPRVRSKRSRTDYRSSGHFGVLKWEQPAKAVTGSQSHDNGYGSVADPRTVPAAKDRPDPVPLIIALDGTWHRPFTTLELAALQGFPVQAPGFGLDGASHSRWRERIGNAVPVGAAAAIASTLLHCLLLQAEERTLILWDTPVWVQPGLATALSMDRPRPELGGAR